MHWLKDLLIEEVMTNNKKDLIQQNAVELSKLHQHLVLEHSTGVGKTLSALKIIEEIIKSNKNAFGYLICKESNHIQNWQEDAYKHKKVRMFANIDILLYASLHKVSKVADFLILDEVHALTDKRVNQLIRLIGPNTKIIMLSATIPYDKMILISMLCKGIVHTNKISLLDAIDAGLLPVPKVIVHSKQLSNSGPRIYNYNMQKGIKSKRRNEICDYKDMWQIFNLFKDVDLTVRCNEKEYYDLITKKMEFHKEQSEKLGQPFNEKIKHKNIYLNLGSQRKRFIADVKTEKSKEIIKQFRLDKQRFICFCGSVNQSLALGVNSSVNSKNKKEDNKHLIDGFNSKMYSELFAVGMMREGMNLTDIEKCLIIQLDSTIGSAYQMIGRSLRSQFPEVHLIQLLGTQDEVYFSKFISDFSEKFITFV